MEVWTYSGLRPSTLSFLHPRTQPPLADPEPVAFSAAKRTLHLNAVPFRSVIRNPSDNGGTQKNIVSADQTELLQNVKKLFGGRSVACDFVDLAQNSFCTRPVAPLQGLI
jgi:hypothetical protein